MEGLLLGRRAEGWRTCPAGELGGRRECGAVLGPPVPLAGMSPKHPPSPPSSCFLRVREGFSAMGSAVRNVCLLPEAAPTTGVCGTRMRCGKALLVSSACVTVAESPATPGRVPRWSVPR